MTDILSNAWMTGQMAGQPSAYPERARIACEDIEAEVLIRDAQERIQGVWGRGMFYEARMLRFMRERFRAPGVVIDVGASIGNHTLYFWKMGAKVVAVEPRLSAMKHLCDNFFQNGHRLVGSDAIDLRSVALSAASGWGRLKGITLREARPDARRSPGDGWVPLVALDEIMKDHRFLGEGLRVQAIKIDTEGYNLPILEGARETLRRHKPDLFIESVEHHGKLVLELHAMGYRPTGFVFNATPTYHFEAVR